MASKSLLPVDPNVTNDAHYRYWMPALQIKSEGFHNGIKTVFPNIREVCRELNRPAEGLVKHFSFELGAQGTHLKQDDKFLVMGSFTQQRLQERVYDFVTRFVLCKECRNPETTPYAKTKSKLAMTCKSCGKETDLTNAGNDRVVALMLAYYSQAKETAKPKAGPATGQAGEQQPEENAAQEEAPAVSVAAVPAKIETTTEQLQKKNPIVELSNLMRQTPPPAADKVIHTALQLKTESNLTDSQMVRIIFRAVIEGVDGTKFIGALQQWRAVLKHFVGHRERLTIIKELGIAVSKYGKPEKHAAALKMLWEESIIDEGTIMDWYANYTPTGKDLSPDFVVVIKKETGPLIDWLNQ